MIDYLADEFRKEQGVDLRRDKLALQRLKEAAEKAKIELSSSKETEINLPFIITDASGPKHLVMKLTRAKFESLAVERGWRVAEPPPEVARELAAAPVSTTDTGTASAEADPEKLLKDAVDAWKRRETIDAIRLATIAAEQGHGRAQELLGHLYGLSAEDDIRNYVQAYMWYHLAAEHFAGTDYWWMRDEVIKSRDWVGKMMPPIQLAEAQRRASEWMEQSESSCFLKEIELALLEAEQAELKEQVALAELTLETTKIETVLFQQRYYQIVGRLYAQLDDLAAQIANMRMEQNPEISGLKAQARSTQQQARRSSEEPGLIERQPDPAPVIDLNLKQAYRRAAKLIRPDLGISVMSVNVAPSYGVIEPCL